MTYDSRIAQIADWLAESRGAVAFTGAGISTESGIPDFRSPGGVWATSQPVYFDDFLSSAAARQEYWRQKSLTHIEFEKAQPNAGHRALARWEQQGRIAGIITQNIDGLHQLAGSQRVWELHGTARQIGCLQCQGRFEADPLVRQYLETGEVPDCTRCGGLLKHATISFGQALPADVLGESARLCRQVDLFLAIGSSLVVHPAAGLPQTAKESGARLVIITRDPTPLDRLADVVINAEIGSTLSAIDALLGSGEPAR
jgi:NAD-dependent deacetylase